MVSFCLFDCIFLNKYKVYNQCTFVQEDFGITFTCRVANRFLNNPDVKNKSVFSIISVYFNILTQTDTLAFWSQEADLFLSIFYKALTSPACDSVD